MDEWQCTHITENLSKLIFQTNFNSAVKAKLQELNILSQSDIDSLDAVEKLSGISEASRQYYRLLTGRINAYKTLTKTLLENRQTGAARILMEGVPNHVSNKPLTHLGIPLNLDDLRDMEIEINGKKLTIREFLPTVNFEKLHQIFQGTLNELEIFDAFVMKQKTFVLAINTVPLKPSYYVPRFLSNRIKIDKSVFKADCQDVFVFKKTIERYKLSQIAKPYFTDTSTSQIGNITSRFIYLDDDEDWNELKKSAKVPIHLINYDLDGKYYLLEDTSAASDILGKLGSIEERVYMSEEEFVEQQLSENCTTSSVCICDTPGMGKTFLLSNIARLMSVKCTGRIVAFIQLTSFASGGFPASPTTISEPETSVIHVLSYISIHPQTSELLLTLIKAEILRLEIFFDGFDEIPTDKIEWTKQVFRSIAMNFPKIRIYITSRPHMRQELENNLGVVAYDILPFNQQNQVDFLVQFWKNSILNPDQLSHQIYATTCLQAVNKSLTKNEKEIAGIPLLCKLIAEVYSDKQAFRSIKTGPTLDVPGNISGMYQKFIKKKMELLAKDMEDFDNIKMVHIWQALKLLFTKKGLHNDTRFKKDNDLLTAKILGVGVLHKHSNGTLEFIHRTFAEYLVAEFLLTKLMEKQKFEEVNYNSMSILKLLLKHHTGACHFVHPVIVFLFNAALGKDHSSEELKMQAALFVSYISHKEFICILHLCCQHNLLNIFCLLTQCLAKWDSSRILECFTEQISYDLLRVCITESTSQLFHKSVQLLSEELKLDLKPINTYLEDYTLLQMAVEWANYEAVEYFGNRISLKNQCLLKNCVKMSYFKHDIEKRENILHLLLNKDPTLIHETPDILIATYIDVRLHKILVKFGANLFAADASGVNCAMYAARYMSSTDYHELVQFLLTEYKAEYLFVNNEKWKDPLPTIIQKSNLFPETLEMLLNTPGIDINMKDKDGDNLLFTVAKLDKLENLRQLVDLGVDYNARGKWNKGLLHVAAKKENVEMVRYLLSLKLDPNSRDKNGWTPLHYAAKGYDRLSVVKVLVENGANVNAKNIEAQTVLHISVLIDYPDKEVMTYLIGMGVGVNDRDNEGNTPLHLCGEEVARYVLVEMGGDIQAKNKNYQTPAQKNRWLR